MQLTSRFAQVTDTNGYARGELAIRAAFDGAGPMVVEHDDRVYIYTGKAGTNLSTGIAVRELATSADSRLWISLDGSLIWED